MEITRFSLNIVVHVPLDQSCKIQIKETKNFKNESTGFNNDNNWLCKTAVCPMKSAQLTNQMDRLKIDPEDKRSRIQKMERIHTTIEHHHKNCRAHINKHQNQCEK